MLKCCVTRYPREYEVASTSFTSLEDHNYVSNRSLDIVTIAS